MYSGFGPDVKAGYPIEEDLSDSGNTAQLLARIEITVTDVELEAILRTPAEIADDILTALASVIGVNDVWASLGYFYLATENDIVPGFEQFRHLPVGTPPCTQRFHEP